MRFFPAWENVEFKILDQISWGQKYSFETVEKYLSAKKKKGINLKCHGDYSLIIMSCLKEFGPKSKQNMVKYNPV